MNPLSPRLLLAVASLVGACGTQEQWPGGSADPSVEGQQTSPEQQALALLDGAELELVFEAPGGLRAADLAFNPAWPRELWVLLRQPYDGAPCYEPEPGQLSSPACEQLEGLVAVLEDGTAAEPSATLLRDPNGWHFLRRPSGIAFGTDDTFATCGEHRTGNWDDGAVSYMGPVLWSADPTIFGQQLPGANGAHLDMLHQSPWCMGIAHQRENVYWAFNGDIGAIDAYDFAQPHEIGGADHSDGKVSRYVAGQLRRAPEVPSNMAFDAAGRFLFVSDTGSGRVVRLDSTSGEPGSPRDTTDEGVSLVEVQGADLSVVVEPGRVGAPSGLALHGDLLIVADHATGVILGFDHQGRELAELDTELGAGRLAGLALGPDERLYLTDIEAGRVLRVVPR